MDMEQIKHEYHENSIPGGHECPHCGQVNTCYFVKGWWVAVSFGKHHTNVVRCEECNNEHSVEWDEGEIADFDVPPPMTEDDMISRMSQNMDELLDMIQRLVDVMPEEPQGEETEVTDVKEEAVKLLEVWRPDLDDGRDNLNARGFQYDPRA